MKPVLLAVSCFLLTLPMAAQNCRSILGQQSPTVASLKQVEDRWDEAFQHGNTEYLGCLLAPDYASVSPKGSHDREWELEHARKNQGSTTPVLSFPGMTFEVHGTTAIARLLKPASADGKQRASYAADVFAFQDGAWRALYSQHTDMETPK